MPKSSCLKWTYGRSGIDYRVALLFTRYLTAIGIIPESLNSRTCRNQRKGPNCLVRRTDGWTDPKCRKTSFLKIHSEIVPK